VIDAPRRLRVGVLLDSYTVPQWVFSILDEIQLGSDAEIALTVLNTAPVEQRRFSTRLQQALYGAYVKIDEKIFAPRIGENAFAPVDARPLLENVTALEVRPLQTRWTDRLGEEDLRTIVSADLDVILRFGFRILKGEILGAARYGVWSFHHDDNRLYRGGPALFWEMYEHNPESGTILQILSERLDGGKVLYRSTSGSDFTSFLRNRNATYWKTARFVGRRLRDLRRSSLEALIEPGSSEMAYDRGIYRIPRSAAMLRFLLMTGWRNVKVQARRRLMREQWFLAVAPRPQSLLESRPSFTVIEPPRHRFYADPFVVEHDQRTFVFFEDYGFDSGRGVVACAELHGGSAAPPRTVLERDYHLSYPAVFEYEGVHYMTPETEQSGNVELYRAVDFPYQWQLDSVLLAGVRGVDPTIFRHQGRFWMFLTIPERGASPHDEVSLFHADALRGPWIPHPSNPVVSNVRSARPAGFPFVEGGSLYRPSQDCAIDYGHSIVLNRIDVLTEQEYRETIVRTIPPAWLGRGTMGTHTLNASRQWLVTDGKKRRLRF